MTYTIRQEQEIDYLPIEIITKEAFSSLEKSNHDEHELIARIRNSDIFIPELSLVASCEKNSEIIGHIMFSKISIITLDNSTIETLALAPLSILPDHQKKGVGQLLVKKGIEQAKKMGYSSIVVLGHPEYYPKFGFKKASHWNIKADFEYPDEALMIYEIQKASLNNISGTINYSNEFF